MSTSYKVSIWTIKPRKNKDGKLTSYGVRWIVDGGEFYESFKRKAQAEGFRADLVSAQRRGEPFDTTTGLPASLTQARDDMTWYDFACSYVDMKWPIAAAKTRQTIAEALMRVTPVFVPQRASTPDAKAIRSALGRWGFNTDARGSETVPDCSQRVLTWCSRNTLSVKGVLSPEIMRALERAATTRLDGKPFSPPVARKNRSVLSNALDYAVDRNLIDVNPLKASKWTNMPKGKRHVDKRAVANPIQARTLLLGVGDVTPSGPRLVAFFAVMYYAALRPEEAVALNKRNLSLAAPTRNRQSGQLEYGWGEIYVEEAWPHAGKAWTGNGQPRDRRHLKSRGAGEGRTVPCPPELTELLFTHMDRFPPTDDGRLFSGRNGGEVPLITYTRVWRAARARTFTTAAQVTPLARRPYDLRHAAVSTWLSGGVQAARVARWAGHSVSVLYEVYASFLDGGEEAARRQVQAALGHKQ